MGCQRCSYITVIFRINYVIKKGGMSLSLKISIVRSHSGTRAFKAEDRPFHFAKIIPWIENRVRKGERGVVNLK